MASSSNTTNSPEIQLKSKILQLPFSNKLNSLTKKLDRNNYGFSKTHVLLAFRAHKLEGYLLESKI